MTNVQMYNIGIEFKAIKRQTRLCRDKILNANT